MLRKWTIFGQIAHLVIIPDLIFGNLKSMPIKWTDSFSKLRKSKIWPWKGPLLPLISLRWPKLSGFRLKFFLGLSNYEKRRWTLGQLRRPRPRISASGSGWKQLVRENCHLGSSDMEVTRRKCSVKSKFEQYVFDSSFQGWWWKIRSCRYAILQCFQIYSVFWSQLHLILSMNNSKVMKIRQVAFAMVLKEKHLQKMSFSWYLFDS